eukprot:CAMPEP_0172783316 /NCGR_PEP_ID=MMETSP1074-20121228/204374_1 /TAXON_ID=2916 /ORGANISM="Ceratium fusus, Strain PA161109" /LENGTH=217 /DNA_ID=CAMNT_0013620305 /DNA_START=1 /DNA_END=654 /DNA_ORIENTATION=+
MSPPRSCHRWRHAVEKSPTVGNGVCGMPPGGTLCQYNSPKAAVVEQGVQDQQCVLVALSAALQMRSDTSSEEEENNFPSRVDCFRARRPPKVDLGSYLLRIRQYIPCSDACFVLALVYIDRIAREEPLLVVDGMTCHRLVLTGIMLATRFHDDEEELHYHNAFFAKVGGFKVSELATMERTFLQLLRWRLFVDVTEYEQYLEMMRGAALQYEVQLAN